jgi:hypothetical protein
MASNIAANTTCSLGFGLGYGWLFGRRPLSLATLEEYNLHSTVL